MCPGIQWITLIIHMAHVLQEIPASPQQIKFSAVHLFLSGSVPRKEMFCFPSQLCHCWTAPRRIQLFPSDPQTPWHASYWNYVAVYKYIGQEQRYWFLPLQRFLLPNKLHFSEENERNSHHLKVSPDICQLWESNSPALFPSFLFVLPNELSRQDNSVQWYSLCLCIAQVGIKVIKIWITFCPPNQLLKSPRENTSTAISYSKPQKKFIT